jgi:hypothetical protein
LNLGSAQEKCALSTSAPGRSGAGFFRPASNMSGADPWRFTTSAVAFHAIELSVREFEHVASRHTGGRRSRME